MQRSLVWQIALKAYDDALIWAGHYGMNVDAVRKAQWLQAEVSSSSIDEFLAKVHSTKWILEECCRRVPSDAVMVELLLKFGSRLCLAYLRTSPGNDSCIGRDTSTCQDEVPHFAERLHRHVARLYTSLQLAQAEFGGASGFNSAAFVEFRDASAYDLAVGMAHLERFGALAVFFHNHCKDTGLNPLEVLQTVPETARPGGYAGLLYSATNKLDIHHKRTSQLQVDGSDLHDKESALLSEFGREKEESDTELNHASAPDLSATNGTSMCDVLVLASSEGIGTGIQDVRRPVPLPAPQTIGDPKTLGMWFCRRAIEIDERSGQLDSVLELLEIGVATGLDDALIPAINRVRQLSILVYHLGCDISLASFEAAMPTERLGLFLDQRPSTIYASPNMPTMANGASIRHCAHCSIGSPNVGMAMGTACCMDGVQASFADFAQECLIPFLGFEPEGDRLLQEYFAILASRSDDHCALALCAALVNESRHDLPIGKRLMQSLPLLISTVLKCIYACSRCDEEALDLMTMMYNALPRRDVVEAEESTWTSETARVKTRSSEAVELSFWHASPFERETERKQATRSTVRQAMSGLTSDMKGASANFALGACNPSVSPSGKAIASIGAAVPRLLDELDQLERHLRAQQLLRDYGMLQQMCEYRKAPNGFGLSSEHGQHVLRALARRIGCQMPPATTSQWAQTREDMRAIWIQACSHLPVDLPDTEWMHALLLAGQFRLAADFLRTPGAQHLNENGTAESLVLAVGRDYFDSARDATDPLMKLVSDCLLVLPSASEAVIAEQRLLEGLRILATYGCNLLPLEIRMHPDRLQIVIDLMNTTSATLLCREDSGSVHAYYMTRSAAGHKHVALRGCHASAGVAGGGSQQPYERLAVCLGVDSPRSRDRLSEAVAQLAHSRGQYAYASTQVLRLIVAGYTDVWELCIALCGERTCEKSKERIWGMLAHSVAHCLQDCFSGVLSRWWSFRVARMWANARKRHLPSALEARPSSRRKAGERGEFAASISACLQCSIGNFRGLPSNHAHGKGMHRTATLASLRWMQLRRCMQGCAGDENLAASDHSRKLVSEERAPCVSSWRGLCRSAPFGQACLAIALIIDQPTFYCAYRCARNLHCEVELASGSAAPSIARQAALLSVCACSAAMRVTEQCLGSAIQLTLCSRFRTQLFARVHGTSEQCFDADAISHCDLRQVAVARNDVQDAVTMCAAFASRVLSHLAMARRLRHALATNECATGHCMRLALVRFLACSSACTAIKKASALSSGFGPDKWELRMACVEEVFTSSEQAVLRLPASKKTGVEWRAIHAFARRVAYRNQVELLACPIRLSMAICSRMIRTPCAMTTSLILVTMLSKADSIVHMHPVHPTSRRSGQSRTTLTASGEPTLVRDPCNAELLIELSVAIGALRQLAPTRDIGCALQIGCEVVDGRLRLVIGTGPSEMVTWRFMADRQKCARMPLIVPQLALCYTIGCSDRDVQRHCSDNEHGDSHGLAQKTHAQKAWSGKSTRTVDGEDGEAAPHTSTLPHHSKISRMQTAELVARLRRHRNVAMLTSHGTHACVFWNIRTLHCRDSVRIVLLMCLRLLRELCGSRWLLKRRQLLKTIVVSSVALTSGVFRRLSARLGLLVTDQPRCTQMDKRRSETSSSCSIALKNCSCQPSPSSSTRTRDSNDELRAWRVLAALRFQMETAAWLETRVSPEAMHGLDEDTASSERNFMRAWTTVSGNAQGELQAFVQYVSEGTGSLARCVDTVRTLLLRWRMELSRRVILYGADQSMPCTWPSFVEHCALRLVRQLDHEQRNEVSHTTAIMRLLVISSSAAHGMPGPLVAFIRNTNCTEATRLSVLKLLHRPPLAFNWLVGEPTSDSSLELMLRLQARSIVRSICSATCPISALSMPMKPAREVASAMKNRIEALVERAIPLMACTHSDGHEVLYTETGARASIGRLCRLIIEAEDRTANRLEENESSCLLSAAGLLIAAWHSPFGRMARRVSQHAPLLHAECAVSLHFGLEFRGLACLTPLRRSMSPAILTIPAETALIRAMRQQEGSVVLPGSWSSSSVFGALDLVLQDDAAIELACVAFGVLSGWRDFEDVALGALTQVTAIVPAPDLALLASLVACHWLPLVALSSFWVRIHHVLSDVGSDALMHEAMRLLRGADLYGHAGNLVLHRRHVHPAMCSAAARVYALSKFPPQSADEV